MAIRQTSCSLAAANIFFLGGCSNQHNSKSINVPLFYNTTTPSPVPKPGDTNGGGDCDCTDGFTTTALGSIWDSGFAGGFGSQEWWQISSSNQDMLTVQSFTQGGTQSFDNCFHIGFKNVVGKRQWHGSYGFNSSDACGTSSQAQGYAPDQTKYTSYSISSYYSLELEPSGALYTCTCAGSLSVNSLTGLITSTLNAIENDYQYYPILDGTKWQNRYLSHCNGWVSYDEGATSSSYQGNAMCDPLVNPYCDGGNIPIPNPSPDQPHSIAEYIATWNNAWSTLPNDGVNFSYNLFVTSAYNPYSFGQSVTGISYYTGSDGAIHHSTQIRNISFGLSATTCAWAFYRSDVGDNDPPSPGENITTTLTCNGTLNLGSSNTAPAIQSDIENNLLSTWNLADNSIYPWRTDDYVTFAPLVMRREVQNNVSPLAFYGTECLVNNMMSPIVDSSGYNPFTTNVSPPPTGWTYIPSQGGIWSPTYNQIPWVDPNGTYWIYGSNYALAIGSGSTNMDGTIIGAPLLCPASGSIGWGWFDFYYDDIHYCQATGDGCDTGWQQFNYAWGGSLADANVSVSGLPDGPQFSTILPMCATHYINNYEAHNFGAGANRLCNEAIYVSKWAQTRFPVPSYNYFRPCGSDRVLINEPTAQCLIAGAANPLTMAGPLVGLTTNNQVLLTYSPADGIYKGCTQTAVGDGTYTLTTGSLVCPLPSDYYHDLSLYYNNADLGINGLVGLVRFPNAWSICGRTNISLTQGYSGSLTGSNVLFFSPQTNLRSGDYISLYGPNMNPTLISHSVSRLSDTNFFINTPTSSVSLSSYWATSTNAPSYDWNDTSQKYSFRIGWWNTSYRTASLNTSSSCSQSCVGYTPCAEQVVCFSPNGEHFVGGVTVWQNSSSFQADGVYGNYQQQNVEFTMPDLLWQAPLTPYTAPSATITIAATMDNGTCQLDVTDPVTDNITAYYPHYPIVEAECALPGGAPALPAGISYPSMTEPGIVGVVGYSFSIPQQPWDYYLTVMSNCVGCRFNYQLCD
jgi:hypothetical protein